ncbi:MAG: trans-aconitate 2-methyltransferase [Candidatus Saganbacteria bacterium]|uniref:Trans-aconitate 2-methyltransferase n=1 Tax=Candidatus Saganbacteria bacterium TaxID=2575572 RepID=A0A833NRG9_UNCSA|nr:MAG: trans-aconitate 2-methyltransferase [Candidatus Saganbacteria bacterium]
MNKSFKWNSGLYKNFSQNQLNWGKELIEKLAPQTGENILDVGCGNGILTAEIAKLAAPGKALGIDSSEDMINSAQQSYSINDYPNLLFKICPIERFESKDAFDGVFSNASLHWVKDHQLALKNIYKALRNGGRIVLQFGGKNNAHQVVDAFEKVINEQKYSPYFNDMEFPWSFLTVEEYKLLLIEIGFTKVDVFMSQKNAILNGKQELEGWIRSTWTPYLSRLPEDSIDSFVREVIECFCHENKPSNKGQFEVEMFRLNVFARKS